MNMNKKSRKNIEIRIIREFLSFMGCTVLRMTSNGNPDAFVIIEEAGKRKKIGIEHTLEWSSMSYNFDERRLPGIEKTSCGDLVKFEVMK